jgi:hypothetical protein
VADEENVVHPLFWECFPMTKGKGKKLLVCNEQLPNQMGKDSVYMRETTN